MMPQDSRFLHNKLTVFENKKENLFCLDKDSTNFVILFKNNNDEDII